MNRIYLASPFFSDAQNERIAKVKAALDQNETVSYVFEPAKHGYESADFGTLEWQKACFITKQAFFFRRRQIAVTVCSLVSGNRTICFGQLSPCSPAAS